MMLGVENPHIEYTGMRCNRLAENSRKLAFERTEDVFVIDDTSLKCKQVNRPASINSSDCMPKLLFGGNMGQTVLDENPEVQG